MWTSQVNSSDFRDARFTRKGGTYMPLSINARKLEYHQTSTVFASDQYLKNVPSVNYRVIFEPYPVMHLYYLRDLKEIGTRIHSTAYWVLSMNEVQRHNLKSNYLMSTKLGRILLKMKDAVLEIAIDAFETYLYNILDLSEFIPENFISFCHEHRKSSTGSKYQYGSMYDSTKQGKQLTHVGTEAFQEAKGFVVRYLTTKISKLRQFVREGMFYRTDLRFSALRVREDPFDMSEIKYKMVFDGTKFRDRVANGIRGNAIMNFGLTKANLRLCYLAVKDFLENQFSIKIISPVTEGVDAYLKVFSWKHRFYADISTADKQMPLFAWALDTTSYSGYGNQGSLQAISESSGGSGTAISNLIYAVLLIYMICWAKGKELPKEVALFGDNIAVDADQEKEFVDLLNNDQEVHDFIEPADRWLGMHKQCEYPQGIKITVDSADKRIGFAESMTSYALDNEIDLNKVTAVLLSKNALSRIGGPNFKDLLIASKQEINEFLVDGYEFHHKLDSIVHDSRIFQKAKDITEAYKDIFFGEYNDQNVSQVRRLIS